MTLSSDPSVGSGLDTMLIVYSLLEGHPASEVCENFIRSRGGWFSNSLILIEVKVVLSKIYGASNNIVIEKLAQLSAGPVVFFDVNHTATLAALKLADWANLDLADALLIETTRAQKATSLATDDSSLIHACPQFGIKALSPINDSLRKDIAAWERSNLEPKGLPRILASVRFWLSGVDPRVAELFWSKTGSGSHLP